MRSLLSDFVLSFRLLVKNPAVSAGAILSLALAVGANTAVFSLVEGVLLRPPPLAHPERLVSLHALDPGDVGGGDSALHSFSYLDYRDLAAGTTALDGILAYDLTPMAWRTGERAEVVHGFLVSPNFFSLLGVDAAVGRTFTAAERGDGAGVAGGDAEVVLGHDLWQRRFHGDPGVVGSPLEVNGIQLTVVGVAPRGFHGPFNGLAAELFVPLTLGHQLHLGEDPANRRLVWLELIGRLAPGVGLEQAQASVDAMVRRMSRDPDVAPNVASDVAPGVPRHQLSGVLVRRLSPVPALLQRPVRLFMSLLLLITGMLLLVAGLNVAGLLLARAVRRRQEIAVRLALGATRARLAAQLLAESVVLFVVAGAVGVLLAQAAVVAVPRLIAPVLTALEVPLDLPLHLDGRVLLATLVLCSASGALFGLTPLVQSTRPARLPGLVAALQSDSGSVAGPRKARLRGALVVVQIAVCVLLVVVAGVLALSLHRSAALDPGGCTSRASTRRATATTDRRAGTSSLASPTASPASPGSPTPASPAPSPWGWPTSRRRWRCRASGTPSAATRRRWRRATSG